MNEYISVLKQYAVFAGRARRREYWMFILFTVIIAVVLNVVGALIHLPIIGTIYSLAVLVPSIERLVLAHPNLRLDPRLHARCHRAE